MENHPVAVVVAVENSRQIKHCEAMNQVEITNKFTAINPPFPSGRRRPSVKWTYGNKQLPFPLAEGGKTWQTLAHFGP